MPMSSMPHAGELEGAPAAELDGRRAGERVAVGHERVLVAIGARLREHPAVLGDAQPSCRLDRAHDDRRAHVDVVVRVHVLRIGQADHPVRGADRGDLLGRLGVTDPRVLVAGRDLAEVGPQRAEVGEVVLGRPPRRGAQRRLEHRVHLHGHVDAAFGLGRLVHVELVADGHGFVALGSLRPVERHPGLAGAHERPPRLAAGEDRHVELAGLDVERGRVDERLRAVAAHRRVAEFGRLDARAGRPGTAPGCDSARTGG